MWNQKIYKKLPTVWLKFNTDSPIASHKVARPIKDVQILKTHYTWQKYGVLNATKTYVSNEKRNRQMSEQ